MDRVVSMSKILLLGLMAAGCQEDLTGRPTVWDRSSLPPNTQLHAGYYGRSSSFEERDALPAPIQSDLARWSFDRDRCVLTLLVMGKTGEASCLVA